MSKFAPRRAEADLDGVSLQNFQVRARSSLFPPKLSRGERPPTLGGTRISRQAKDTPMVYPLTLHPRPLLLH